LIVGKSNRVRLVFEDGKAGKDCAGGNRGDG
jgi:hypothetical protein